MSKTILITGSTDGLGLEAAKILVSHGHTVLLHGRNGSKLANVAQQLAAQTQQGKIKSYTADLSDLADVRKMIGSIKAENTTLDVLVNNAGVYSAPNLRTKDELDLRFAVNTIAPYMLAKALAPLIGSAGRIINLSSAAQSPINIEALAGRAHIADEFTAYAQSKLALTMWSREMALSLENTGPIVVALNPGSMLGTKMVKDAFGVSGKSMSIGAEIIVRAALSDEFKTASGRYFDNDSGQFSPPHPDGLDRKKSQQVVQTIEHVLAERS